MIASAILALGAWDNWSPHCTKTSVMQRRSRMCLYGFALVEGDCTSTESDFWRVVVMRGVVSCAGGPCESCVEIAMIGRDGRVSE